MPIPAGLGGFYGRKLDDLPQDQADSIRNRRRAAGIHGPTTPIAPPGAPGAIPPDADATIQEIILSASDRWKPVLYEGLGLGMIGALAYMLYQEAQGRPTLISKLSLSPTGTELVRGAWNLLGKAAQAGVSSPIMGFLTGWAAVQLMQKSKICTEKAGAYATAGMFGLAGVSVASDTIGALTSVFGGKDAVGPNNVTFGDDEHVTYVSEMSGPVFDLIKQNGYALPGVKRASLTK